MCRSQALKKDDLLIVNARIQGRRIIVSLNKEFDEYCMDFELLSISGRRI